MQVVGNCLVMISREETDVILPSEPVASKLAEREPEIFQLMDQLLKFSAKPSN